MKWNTSLYDSKHSFVSSYGEEVVQLLNPEKDETILDLGCGTGYLTNVIFEQGAKVTGLDVSQEMISAAREKYPHILFVAADARTFSFPQPFDAVFSNAAIHWMPEPEKVARNIYNALKPKGRFVAEFGGKDNVGGIFKAMRKTLADFGYKKNAEISVWFYPSVGEYASILEACGFDVCYAAHFERQTKLEGDDGMKNWFAMFADLFFKDIPEEERKKIIEKIETLLRPTHFRNGEWFADYRRLRVTAIKE
ncbi:MAG: methyltransferase domain-containing protein [Bacteroidetes bacterium]|nr:methyltransferase domain-containing protein [Bacteroidota bacterium]